MGDNIIKDAAFRTVRLEKEASPAGRMFFCHHLTPDLVWNDPWRRHPNGATALQGMLIAATDPAAYAALFALMFGETALRTSDQGSGSSVILTAGLATIEIATPVAVATRLGEAAPPLEGRPATMAALIVRTASLSLARTALEAGGIPTAPHEGSIIVPAAQAGNLALVFVE